MVSYQVMEGLGGTCRRRKMKLITEGPFSRAAVLIT